MTQAGYIAALRKHLEGALLGRSQAVAQAMVCLVAGGHLLIEDVPGVGKTTLARAMAGAFALSFRRVQFTSDLLPADILGVSVFDPSNGRFQFKPGPVFTNVLLADELNRATPRTQSALLEAMSEGQVSGEEATYKLPEPFIVIATQNPVEHYGTFPLPESQLDRFLMRIEIGYPDKKDEKLLLTENRRDAAAVESMPTGALLELQSACDQVKLESSLADYLLLLVHETREAGDVELGVSTRGALALKRASQGYALVRGRDYVTPDDIQVAAEGVLAHRLVLKRAEGGAREKTLYIRKLLERVEAPV
jgi:MoxR-like ATPase